MLLSLLLCGLALSPAVAGVSTQTLRRGIISASDAAEEAEKAAFDYVICGGGLAGCVLANRLSSAGKRVLMLEAGGSKYHQLRVTLPAGVLKLFQTDLDWTYFSEGERDCYGRPIYLCRGKILGGSSCTNVLLHFRGSAQDYDAWDAKGWTASDVLPFFVKSHNDATGRQANAPLFHGLGGEWNMDDVRYQNPLSRVFLTAAQEAGLPLNDDFNNWDRPQVGAGRFQVSEKNGARVSGASAFLDPILKKRSENLVVATGARVQKLRVETEGESAKATGVVFADEQGQQFTVGVKPDGEILLCGGAVTSPHWLLLSGIGEKSELEYHGIDCVVDLPEVGKNLQDHPAAVVSYTCNRKHSGISVTSKLRVGKSKIPNPWPVLQWFLTRSGLLTSVGCDHGAFYNTSPARNAQPDLQIRFLAARAVTPDGMNSFTKFREKKAHEDGFSFQAIAARAKSRGSVSLRSADPDNTPRIDCAYLSHEDDIATIREGIKLGRKMGMSPAFDKYRGEEVFPGPKVQTDDEIEDYIKRTLHTANALVGTCSMGPVVDEALRVRGVDGLRVCDASVIPVIPGGQTATPVVMIAERAAQFLLSPVTSPAVPDQEALKPAAGEGEEPPKEEELNVEATVAA